MRNFFVMRLPLALVACLLTTPLAAWSAADPNQPQSYALHLPLRFSSAASLQRVRLSAQVLVNLQSNGLSDLRIFNGQGQPLSMAWSGSASLGQTENRKLVLPSLPIMGAPDAKNILGSSLRIEEQHGQRTVQIDTSEAAAGQPPAIVLGAILDTRAVADPVVDLALNVDLPDSRPITFTLQSSTDLKDWQPLAETVLYRAAASASSLGADHVALPGASLKGHYVRVSWNDAGDPRTPVTMHSATLTTARGVSSASRVSAALTGVQRVNAYELRFGLPFATPLAALKITAAGDSVLIPVRVLGRNDSGQPWTALASGVIYRLQSAGKVQQSEAFALPPETFREIKIEADRNSSGFSTTPQITLEFEPMQVVALVSGPPPFTLAAGLANATSLFLPMQSLLPGYAADQENSLPLATLDSAAAVVAATASSEGMASRHLGLWGVLLAAVLALGAMAWVLLKQNNKPPAGQ